MLRIGHDRIGVPPVPKPPKSKPVVLSDRCPLDGAVGVFHRMALICPRCGRLLGGC